MKKFTNVVLSLFLVLAAATTLAQNPRRTQQAQQLQRSTQPQEVPAGSTPLEMTDAEITSLASSYKDGNILSLQKRIIDGDLQKVQDASDAIEQQTQQWRNNFRGQLAKVKLDHKWGDDVIFDFKNLGFVRLPAAAVPSTAVKPNTAVIPTGPQQVTPMTLPGAPPLKGTADQSPKPLSQSEVPATPPSPPATK